MGLKDAFIAFQKATIAAVSYRAAIRGEIYPIDVTTTPRTFVVPDAWKGNLVRMQADGGDLYYQISTTATAAACTLAARVTEAGTSPITITPAATGAIKISPAEDVQFPLDAQTFCLFGSATMVARCNLSET